MHHEIADELRRTLAAIGPATYAEVAADVRGRVRLGLLMLSRETEDLPAALAAGWRDLVAAAAVEELPGVPGTFRARPLAAIATGADQLRLFV